MFEDYQWADASSLELLDLMADRIRSRPVLLVITSRPGFEPAWGGLAHVREISLDRMVERDARALIENLSWEQDLPGDIIDQIIARTDGIPLFLEEMTEAVLDVRAAAGAQGDAARHSGDLTLLIPSTLQDLLADRLDRLGDAKATAQIASVIGREFSEGAAHDRRRLC